MTTDTYDANGNTLTSNGHSFGYDFEDRLTSYDSGVVAFVYDGDGNRVVRSQGGVTTRYLIDDLTPTGYAQVVEELTAGAVSRRYTHGALRISQSQLINGNWTTHYYGYDGGGTVRQLFDAGGVVTDTYDYDAFGAVIGSTGSTPNTFLYRGEHYDSTLDMYYLRARWYWPRVGRFVTQDKIDSGGHSCRKGSCSSCGCAVGQTCIKPGCSGSSHSQCADSYLYADADPVNRRDPLGRQASAATWAATLAWQDIVTTGLVTVIAAEIACIWEQTNGLLERAAGSFGTSLQILPTVCRKKGKKMCTYKCTRHVINMPGHGNDGVYYTAQRYGKDCTEACALAWEDLKAQMGAGAHPQHCPIYERCESGR